MSDKDIHVTSTPEPLSPWPVPPVYEALWSAAKIHEAIQELVTYRGHEALSVVDLGELLRLVFRICNEYDLELAKAQRQVWALSGLLEVKAKRVTYPQTSIDLEEDAK